MNLIWYINNSVSIYLNNFILNNHLEKVIWVFSDAPIFFLPLFLFWAWLYWTFKEKNDTKKEGLLFILYSIIASVIINTFVKLFVFENRPDTLINPILQHIPDNSFPSDHASVSFAFLFALYASGYKKTFWVFSPFVILMNFSRIAGWLHWFWDVIVWLFLWLIAVIIIYKNSKNKYVLKLNSFILKIMSFVRL